MKKSLLIGYLLLRIVMSCSPEEEKVLKIGVIPAQTEGELKNGVEKLRLSLEEGLKMPVEIDVYPAYAGVVEAINYKKIDLAYFGPFTYAIANVQSGAQAIVTQLIDGKPYYHSYLITQKEKPLSSIEDVVQQSTDLTMAFGSINSTSGYIVPSSSFQDLGIFNNQNDHSFKNVQFAGSHDVVSLLIQNGTVDLGCIDGALFNSFIKSGRVDTAKVKVIWQSEPIFQYPWAVHGEMDEKLKTDIQDIFLKIKDPEVLKAFGGASGFTKASDEDYKRIKEIAKKRDLLK